MQMITHALQGTTQLPALAQRCYRAIFQKRIKTMPDEPDNLVLRYLRNMDVKMDRTLEDLHDIKVRVTSIEESISGVNRRLDRIEERVDKIERRLEMTEA